jgi:hypothetical protein
LEDESFPVMGKVPFATAAAFEDELSRVGKKAGFSEDVRVRGASAGGKRKTGQNKNGTDVNRFQTVK